MNDAAAVHVFNAFANLPHENRADLHEKGKKTQQVTQWTCGFFCSFTAASVEVEQTFSVRTNLSSITRLNSSPPVALNSHKKSWWFSKNINWFPFEFFSSIRFFLLFTTNDVHFLQSTGASFLYDSSDQLDFIITKDMTDFAFCTQWCKIFIFY